MITLVTFLHLIPQLIKCLLLWMSISRIAGAIGAIGAVAFAFVKLDDGFVDFMVESSVRVSVTRMLSWVYPWPRRCSALHVLVRRIDHSMLASDLCACLGRGEGFMRVCQYKMQAFGSVIPNIGLNPVKHVTFTQACPAQENLFSSVQDLSTSFMHTSDWLDQDAAGQGLHSYRRHIEDGRWWPSGRRPEMLKAFQ